RHPDHDQVGLFLADHGEQSSEAGIRRRPLDDARRPRDEPGGVGDGDSGTCGAEVERQQLHCSAAARASRPAASAPRSPATFLPPAWASAGPPPPPPPMIGPRLRTTATASIASTDLSRLTTSDTFPSSAEPRTTAMAASRWRTWSERSRSSEPRAPATSAT